MKLLKLFKKAKRCKNSGPWQKKLERLGVDLFDGSMTDTQRFIHDVEIELNYFKDFLVDDMDEITLVIPPVQKATNPWYQDIHSYIYQKIFILGLRRRHQVQRHPTSFFRPLRPRRPDPIFKRLLHPDLMSDLNNVPLRPHSSCSSRAAYLTS